MTLFTDNARSPSVGSVRAGIGLSQANIFTGGDGFSVDYTHTEGSDGLDLRYSLPVNARNGRLSLAHGRSHSEVIEESVEELDINSDSRYYEASFRQPLIETPEEELALSITASRQESEGRFLEAQPFPTAGADAEGRTRISSLRLGQDWIRRGEGDVLALASELTIGLDAFDSTINERRPDSRFVAWQGQGQWVRQIARDSIVLVRGALQLADGPLVPMAQFGVGGNTTVRGYRANTLLTDNGWLGAAEVRLPIVRIPKYDGTVQIAPFIDVGGGWNNGDNPDPDPGTIVSTGLGLILDFGDAVSARLDWGIPLTSIDNEGDSLQESGIHFSIKVFPF
ncbi:MAG: ShlB/FhaC/HecB family hemolysin secretion/activation protein [Okeania sp. SIO2G5]|nr:ShlB/FhaC/HecB family hemolysin secretion/activation protein [Okeania sp. SIO2G5]